MEGVIRTMHRPHRIKIAAKAATLDPAIIPATSLDTIPPTSRGILQIATATAIATFVEIAANTATADQPATVSTAQPQTPAKSAMPPSSARYTKTPVEPKTIQAATAARKTATISAKPATP